MMMMPFFFLSLNLFFSGVSFVVTGLLGTICKYVLQDCNEPK